MHQIRLNPCPSRLYLFISHKESMRLLVHVVSASSAMEKTKTPLNYCVWPQLYTNTLAAAIISMSIADRRTWRLVLRRPTKFTTIYIYIYIYICHRLNTGNDFTPRASSRHTRHAFVQLKPTGQNNRQGQRVSCQNLVLCGGT